VELREARGAVYRELGRYEEALADLDRAIRLAPHMQWAVRERDSAYREKRENDPDSLLRRIWRGSKAPGVARYCR
jgi:tetratricopeptide (TPR) repeat protein